jgi:IS5 family transposase
MHKKARYKGIAKNQCQDLIQAFAYNLKKLTKIAAPPLIFA